MIRAMNLSHLTLILLSPLALAPAARGQDPNFAKIIDQGINNSHVMDFQDQLSNGIGQRLTGSLNFQAACEWALEEFQKMGLDARLEQWAEWNMGWDRGQWSGRVTSPENIELHVATPAWTGGTKGQVEGRLIRMPENIADFEAALSDGPAYLWGPLSRRDREKGPVLEQLARDGKLLGVVMSALDYGAADNNNYPNQIRVFGDNQALRRPWESRARLVQVVVRNDHAEKLAALVDGPDPVTVQFEIRNKFRKGPIQLYNVVADLKGTEFPDEVVVVCGHLDSWHQAAGATDNGTGTCSTMEAARILTASGIRPKRTIRFMLWGGEEEGLLGSRQYVVEHRSEMDKVSMVLNHDNGTNWASALRVTTLMAPMLEAAVTAINTLPKPNPSHEGPIFQLRANPTLPGSSGGSDHASFSATGVPAVGWSLTGERPYGYGWHSQWDTYDIVVPAYQRHNATTIALMSYQIAQAPTLMPREGVLRPGAGGGRGGRGRRGGRRGQAGLIIGGMLGGELSGLQFTSIADSGFAKTAKLQVGDTITEINGTKVTTPVEVNRAIREARGTTLTLKVSRNGQEVSVTGPRPGRRRRG